MPSENSVSNFGITLLKKLAVLVGLLIVVLVAATRASATTTTWDFADGEQGWVDRVCYGECLGDDIFSGNPTVTWHGDGYMLGEYTDYITQTESCCNLHIGIDRSMSTSSTGASLTADVRAIMSYMGGFSPSLYRCVVIGYTDETYSENCQLITVPNEGWQTMSVNATSGKTINLLRIVFLAFGWGPPQGIFQIDNVQFNDGMPTPTPSPGPTATPSPTSDNFSTAQPWATLACVAPTARPTGTPFRTSTPFGPTHTPTIPAATNTPGGPTATPTPTTTQTYTGTVTNFALGPVEFGQNLNPWGAAIGPNWGMSGTSWLNATGWDNLPGVASLPWVDASTNAATYTGTSIYKDALVYIKCDGVSFCTPLPARALRLTGLAQNDPFIIGDSLAIDVYLLDLNYFGYRQQAWFKADSISIGTDAEWRAFTKVINFDYGLSREIGGITLVAAYTQGGGGPHPPLPAGYLRLDHLLLAVGSTADYVNSNLPVCSAPGAGTNAVRTKVCTIQRTKTDVMAACGEIGGITEIGNALNVFRCRFETYFTFNNYNRQQLLEMRERQAYNEPIGTFNDISKVIAQFQELLTEMSYINTPTTYTPFDFAQSMSGGALDDFFTRGPQLHVVTEQDGFSDYQNTCPQAILDWSSTASRGSCFVVAMLRGTPVVSAMQWLLNALFLLFLLAFVWRTATRLANA